MSRLAQMLIFLAVFIAVYLLLNSYVILRLMDLFGIERGFWAYLAIAFMGLSIIATTWLAGRSRNIIVAGT